MFPRHGTIYNRNCLNLRQRSWRPSDNIFSRSKIQLKYVAHLTREKKVIRSRINLKDILFLLLIFLGALWLVNTILIQVDRWNYSYREELRFIAVTEVTQQQRKWYYQRLSAAKDIKTSNVERCYELLLEAKAIIPQGAQVNLLLSEVLITMCSQQNRYCSEAEIYYDKMLSSQAVPYEEKAKLTTHFNDTYGSELTSAH